MVFYLGAIARNISNTLLNFQLFAGEFLDEFPDARVFVYENNSTDTTKYLLQLWSTLNTRVTVKCEDIAESELKNHCIARSMDNTPCRMEAIAFARNRLITMLEETDIGSREEDRIIFFDPDVHCMMSAEPLIKILKDKSNDYDALFANGISQRKNYYDISAYYDMYYPFGLELLDEKLVFGEKYKAVIQQIPTTVPRIPVFSAFGGIGVYRASCIRGLRYKGVVTEDVHSVFTKFCSQFPAHPWVQHVKKKPTSHLNGALLGVYLYDKDLFYKNNSGYNYPVICEHVSFHCSMICRGYSRLFVEPSLLYYSDHWE
jgi:hypothetical protein